MKNFRIPKSVFVPSIIFLTLFMVMRYQGKSQEIMKNDFSSIEKIENQNEDYLKNLYKIVEKYPSFSYNYDIENGKVKNVIVTGVENVPDKKEIRVEIMDLKSNLNKIKGQADRIGVFYSVDQDATYKKGEKALNAELVRHLHYPQKAKNWGVDGTVLVKFVVDEKGNISYASTTHNIETSMNSYVEDLEKQAVEAIKMTSGDWEPGMINGVKVPSLVVVPITFHIKKDPGISHWIR